MALLPSSDYVSDEALANLKLYKYAAVDKSYLTHYVLRHYWNWAVNLFPMWMAPNLITLCGFGFIGLNILTIFYYMPDLETQGPPWVYYGFAAGMWLYSTFDNVDGKQARRTGTSSPLGELFDHGCDALNCAAGAMVQAAGLALGNSWYSAFLFNLTSLTFYLSTWEEYHTGILYLGYINGPTEGLLLSCITFGLSGYFGPGIWRMPLASFLPPSLLGPLATVELRDISVSFILFTGIVFHVAFCFRAVWRVRKEKGLPLLPAFAQLLPVVLFLAAYNAWVFSPHSSVMSANLLLPLTLTAGVVFGRIATKIILAHLTKAPFPMWTVLIAPLVLGAILVNLQLLSPSEEILYLGAFAVFATTAYLHWALLVIDRFCSYLGIRCLHIPPVKKE